MIRINDDYVITTDENNFVLCKDMKRTRKEDGKPVYKSLGYYGTLSHALEGLAQRSCKEKISQDDEISLKEAIEAVRQEYERLSRDIRVAVPDVVGGSDDEKTIIS